MCCHRPHLWEDKYVHGYSKSNSDRNNWSLRTKLIILGQIFTIDIIGDWDNKQFLSTELVSNRLYSGQLGPSSQNVWYR